LHTGRAEEKIEHDLNPDGFAAEVTKLNTIAKITRAPIRGGDIVYAVDGVEDCAVARTAFDYIQLRHKPGEKVELGVIADGRRTTRTLRLFKNPMPEALRKFIWSLKTQKKY
jgi:S1-C subfamily serine protease